MGINWRLRRLKRKAHKLMDAQWKSGLMTRGQMYAMLRRELGTQIHISQCNEIECRQVIALFSSPVKIAKKLEEEKEAANPKPWHELQKRWFEKSKAAKNCKLCGRLRINCKCEYYDSGFEKIYDSYKQSSTIENG